MRVVYYFICCLFLYVTAVNNYYFSKHKNIIPFFFSIINICFKESDFFGNRDGFTNFTLKLRINNIIVLYNNII